MLPHGSDCWLQLTAASASRPAHTVIEKLLPWSSWQPGFLLLDSHVRVFPSLVGGR